MHRRIKIGGGVALALALVFGAVTWVALEGQEVVVLRTFDETGGVHEAHTWVADEDGYVWIESANTERPFYRRILAHPDIELERGGAVQRWRAEVVTSPDGHTRIRRLLAQKYGWADCWIGLLADTSDSRAIRLTAP